MENGGDDHVATTTGVPVRIPVFVFPQAIIFNGNDREHMKQILTVYNPYEFPVRFKVLSTAPNNYTVINPEGCISTKNSVDLIVRLTAVPNELAMPYSEDKFRVQLYDYNTRTQVGKKDVPSVIHFGHGLPPGSTNSSLTSCNYSGEYLNTDSSASEAFQHYPSLGLLSSASVKDDPTSSVVNAAAGGGAAGGMFYSPAAGPPSHYNPNYVAVLTALVCILALMLPTSLSDRDFPPAPGTSSSVPNYLHLSVNQKLLIAYTLGLVTMVIFRPQ